ncbi:putative transcription factor MYB-HB-like family [Helianthus debilis subsp. tardiflorus]
MVIGDLKSFGFCAIVLCCGVKFSAEEERTVIELQGQFGNKWARIATYLPGRTNNDVKNFWSSRQKRLARVLQSPPRPQLVDGRDEGR